MKAGVFYGAEDMRPEEVEVPETGPDDVLIKVMSCGICGSDLHAFRQGIFSRPGWIMGHELSGEAAKVGENVKDIKVGDRLIPMPGHHGGAGPEGCGQCFWCIRGLPRWCENRTAGRKPCGKCEYCVAGQWWNCKEMLRYHGVGYGRNGGYAEYAAVYNAALNKNIYRLPDNMSFDEGAAVEPLRGCLEWIAIARPEPHETAVVTGLGTIGLMMMQVLKTMVSKVLVSEVSEMRLQAARELEVDLVIDAGREDPIEKVIEVTGIGRSGTGKGGGRADFVMECSGAGIALQQALEMTRAGGRIVMVGLFEKPATIDANRIIFKDLKLLSSQPQSRIDFKGDPTQQAIDLISSGKVKVKPLISHEFSVDEIKRAFEIQSVSTESVKVIVKP